MKQEGAAGGHAIRSVGILGAGMMGTAIAAAHVRHGVPVVVSDASKQAVQDAPEKIARELGDDMDATGARQLVDRLVQATDDLAAAARCDLVLESVFENFDAKQRLFASLEPGLAESAILASNTSTIPIGRLAERLADPARFCGTHFCHPVRKRPVVEIVRGPQTSEQTIATVVAHAKAIKRTPIVVEDGPGFLINRLLLFYVGEAMELLLEGAGIEAIERAATDFGMAKGPLRLLDEIGLDTTLHGGVVLASAFPERMPSCPLLVMMVKAGRTGCKAGAGFFSYPAGASEDSPGCLDPAVDPIIAQWAGTPQGHTSESITARLFLPMVLEATRILEEGKVRDAGDIDLGVVLGLGFPAWRGGLLRWADSLGAARIIEMLEPLERLGPRAQPTAMLLELARSGGRFVCDKVRG